MNQLKTAITSLSVHCPRPSPDANASKCEFTLNVGFFFDGTDNNKDHQESKTRNTNVVRLSEAYREDPVIGSFRNYVAGVGTPFTQIDESKAPIFGGPAGAGGEERIIFALFQIINSVYGFLNEQAPRFNRPEMAALCSSDRIPPNPSDSGAQPARLTARQQTLQSLGLERGLVGDRRLLGEFLRKTASELSRQVTAHATLPKIKSIYIDVFGFSRGAAQARVFVSWLHEFMLGRGELFGVPSYVRMLGLFDTVSSVGRTEVVGGNGHSDWALAEDLPIHPDVKNCVHFVALHELRTNFPCDSILPAEDAVLPPGWCEHFYPGAHSDVGGGYAPGEQGKGIAFRSATRFEIDDASKLSQVPSNDMFDAAVAVCRTHECMPWIELDSPAGVRAELGIRFALTRNGEGVEIARRAVNDYFQRLCRVSEGLSVREALRAHALCYLAWRYQVNEADRFDTLPSVQRAAQTDREGVASYRRGQQILSTQLRLLSTPAPIWDLNLLGDKDVRNGFSRHAPEIYAQMKALKQNPGVGDFFDLWVHDSYAGFIGKFNSGATNWVQMSLGNVTHLMAESQRYVRWRGLYCGGDRQLNARERERIEAVSHA